MRDAQLLLDTLAFGTSHDPAALSRRWRAADGLALITLAEREGASLWLTRKLRDAGIEIPDEARQRLASHTRFASAHAIRVDEESCATLALLERGGFAGIPLKGAAVRRIAHRVPYIDARAISDVDVLVPKDQADAAWQYMRGQGYSAAKEVGPALGHHLAALSGPLGVSVELHVTTVAEVAPAEAWRRASVGHSMADFSGTRRPIPSDTELFWHAMSHALITEEELVRKGLRLRNWLDAVAMIAADADIDWETVRLRCDAPETPHPRLARAWLRAAIALSGREVAPELLGAPTRPYDLARQLSWRLRLQAQAGASPRWTNKLLEEGTRGEAGMPYQPANSRDGAMVALRHSLAARAARAWWIVRR